MSSKSRVQSGWSNVARSSAISNKPNFGGLKEKGKEEEVEEDKVTEVATSFQYMKVQPIAPSKKEIEVSVLADGIVLMRNYVSLEMQQKFVDNSILYGEGKVEGVHSFYDGILDQREGYDNVYPSEESSEIIINPKGKLNMINKARITIPTDKYWKEGLDYSIETLEYARKFCSSLPSMIPGHCLLNYYRKGSKLGWHTDRIPGISKEEQEKETAPVVSISIGDEGDFMIKSKMTDKEIRVVLRSGDVIIFGGPARNALHTVYKIFPNTTPKELNMRGYTGRFNLTFRAR